MRFVDDLVSLSADDPPEAQALAAHLREDETWLEVVAGIDSVVVRFDATVMDTQMAQRRIDDLLAGGVPPLPSQEGLIEIPVVYGGEYGPDLEDVCRQLGLSIDELVALHTDTDYLVDMVGFTPGFAFVGGLDPRLRVSRRKEPRQRVEAGSIGIADARTGMYAVASPGGWMLIGRTPYRLFDANAADPFPIRAGMRVRFTAISADDFDA